MGKRGKRGNEGKYVQLHEWFLQCESWQSLGVGPRALYVELKRFFNGSNNGTIFLSHRDAANALNCNRQTAGRYFQELEEWGFIKQTCGPCLGPSGKGKAAQYALTELPVESTPATKEFMREKLKAPSKYRTGVAEISNRGGSKIEPPNVLKFENPATFAQNSA